MSKRAAWVVGIVAAAILAIAVIPLSVLLLRPPDAPPAAEPTPTVSASPTATPEPTGPAENSARYDSGSYPTADVFLVEPALPVDDSPDEPALGETATPATDDGAPVFGDPDGEPVAWLPQEQRYGGTVVPIVERYEHWVRVLLVGRHARAGEGDAGQLSGWLRTADVEIAPVQARVEVDLEARTVDIVTVDNGTGDGGARERVADGFAWGTDDTPTPVGRSFVMLTEKTSFAYAKGHPIVYLSVQSPTLASFGGDDVAITAFHYHDQRSGPISNGCIRLGAEAIERLAELPAGTPVRIL